MDAQFFDQILAAAVNSGTSDIHIKVGSPIMIRDHGDILPVMDSSLTVDDVEQIIQRLFSQATSKPAQQSSPLQIAELTDHDASFSLQGIGRFRVNIYRQRGTLAVTMRVIPSKVPEIDELHLPEVLKEIALEPRGLILITGITGSGKSTSLAALINHINQLRTNKIITIEDPIEFMIDDQKCFISQREVGCDTISFSTALRAALRQDPDVIMVGEMRDRETIEISLKAAETGHVVLSTVHTKDAEGTISRLIGAFDPSEHSAVRRRVVDSLQAVISQRLVPRKNSDTRIAAIEIMRMTSAIRERILNADPRGFRELVEKGWNPYRMQTFDQHLSTLVKEGFITFETGLANSTSPTNFKRSALFDE